MELLLPPYARYQACLHYLDNIMEVLSLLPKTQLVYVNAQQELDQVSQLVYVNAQQELDQVSQLVYVNAQQELDQVSQLVYVNAQQELH